MAITGAVPFKLYRRLSRAGLGYVSSTIAGNVVISSLDEEIMSYDGGGSNRDVKLPDVAECKGQQQWVRNHGATNTLVVKNAGGTQIGTSVAAEAAGLFASDGTNWIRVI